MPGPHGHSRVEPVTLTKCPGDEASQYAVPVLAAYVRLRHGAQVSLPPGLYLLCDRVSEGGEVPASK